MDDRRLGTEDDRTRGLGSDEVRHHNLGAMLEILHLSGPTARSELTRRTGLNRSTIARLITELATAGLVEESTGAGRSGPGRPSPIVSPVPGAAPALAMEVTLDTLTAALVGFGGTTLERVELRGDWGAVSEQRIAQELGQLATPLVEDAGDALVGAAVAIPGIVGQRDGLVRFAPNLGWTDVPFGNLLGTRLPLDGPIRVGNEANLGALAEHRRTLSEVTDLVYVHADVGIGVGIIAAGRQLTGGRGYASEGGHMTVRADGSACRCGARGCWETEIGEESLVRRTLGAERRPGRIAIEDLGQRLDAGDKAARSGVEYVGYWLGVGIGNLGNLLGPEVVVIGGIYANLFGWMEESIAKGVSERVLDVIGEDLRILPSSMGPDAPLMGAAESVLSGAIAQPSRIPALGRGRG